MRGERDADRSARPGQGDPRPDGRIDAAGLSSVVVGGDGDGCGRALTPFFHAFREREAINDIMEETCGARLTMNYMVPGGVMADIHPDFQKRVKEFIRFFATKIDEYDELVTGNIIFKSRMEGVGYLSPESAVSYGCSGPTARGSGVSCDIRKLYPYEVYGELNFEEVTAKGGDCFSRYMVRMQEMRQSVSIIEQLIDNIPEGEFPRKNEGSAFVLPQRRVLFKGGNGAGQNSACIL